MNTALHDAVMGGNVTLVRKIMQTTNHDVICAQNEDFETALHLAVRHGSMDMIRSLCPRDNPLALDIEDRETYTPFLRAVQYPEKANYFLDICPSVLRHRTVYSHNALHLVSQLQLAQRIYTMDPSLLQSNDIVNSPVHTNARTRERNVDTVMYLLTKNPKLLAKRNAWNETPLLSAYRYSHKALVEAILSWKPNWSETTPTGHTSLHMIAVCASNSDVVTRVLQHSLRDLSSDVDGTPYVLAVRHDNLYSKHVLQQHETCDSIIQTHVTLKKNCWPSMQSVVDCLHRFVLPELTTIVFTYMGLEPLSQNQTIKNKMYKSYTSTEKKDARFALYDAIADGNITLVAKILQTATVDNSICAQYQESALHIAVRDGSMDMVRYLCPRNDVRMLHILDFAKQTPFLRALQYPEKANYFLDICRDVLKHRDAKDHNPLHLASTLQLTKRIYNMEPSLLDEVSSVIGNTPVHTFSNTSMRHVDSVVYLLAQKPELLTQRNFLGETPLASAYSHADFDLVNAILSWKPDWKETSMGHTVLHMIAACATNSDVVTRVLQHAFTDLLSNPEETPYKLAVYYKNVYSQYVLEQYEACDSIIQTHVTLKRNCWPKMQPVVDCLHQFLLPDLTTMVFTYLGLEPLSHNKTKIIR